MNLRIVRHGLFNTMVTLASLSSKDNVLMPESSQLIRQWKLLLLLSSRRFGVTLKELSAEFDVSSRTIHRDLNHLKTAGFRLDEKEGEFGRKHWQLSKSPGIANLNFTIEEAAALYLGRQFMESFAGTLFWQGSRSAYGKIRATLGETVIEYLELLANSIHLQQQYRSDYSSRESLIDALMLAIEDRKLTVITYHSLRSTEPVTLYDIHPYALVFHKGALYVVANSLDHQEIRTFKVDRISEVEVQSGLMKFRRPPDFRIKDYLCNSFGIFGGGGTPRIARVKFQQKVVRLLEEKTFHPSQQLKPQADGSVVAEFRLASFEEFSSWVLSFGRYAKVLEPEELVEQMREEVAAMGAVYDRRTDLERDRSRASR